MPKKIGMKNSSSQVSGNSMNELISTIKLFQENYGDGSAPQDPESIRAAMDNAKSILQALESIRKTPRNKAEARETDALIAEWKKQAQNLSSELKRAEQGSQERK